MKTLLVEDSDRKADKITSFLRRYYPQAVVAVEKSYQSGLKRIEVERFAVILLDMTLPTFDATPTSRYGRPRPLGGYDILRKMHRQGVCTPVILVTQLEHFGAGQQQYTFDQITSLCLQEFPESFRGSVFFSQANNDWEHKLKLLIDATGVAA